MSENEGKRIRRSPEERAAAVDEQIAKINQTIEELEQKKKAVLAEYDDKIAAAKRRIKALDDKKKAILAPKKAKENEGPEDKSDSLSGTEGRNAAGGDCRAAGGCLGRITPAKT